MLLWAENIEKNYGMKQLLKGVNIYINENDKVGIIGINGTGKSTFLRILAKEEEADSGEVFYAPNLRLNFLKQNPDVDESLTVIEQVFRDLPNDYRTLHEYEAIAMLNKLGITDFSQKMGTLSGGQKKRVALATVLISECDILILDEPTNHLDSFMVTWLEKELAKFKGGLIMITHDRYFLSNVVNKITEVDKGNIYNYEGNYSKYLELKAQREEMEFASERKRQAILKKELAWVMRGARARSTKSKGRIERYENLKAQSAPELDDKIEISSLSSRLGRKTLELNNISKAYDGKQIIKDFSYTVLRDDRIGIVGENGAGKTTLLNILCGIVKPDSGTLEMGQTVKIGYFSQESENLPLNERVHDFIKEIGNEIKTSEGTFSATQMLERFLFPTDLQFAKISALSGGEKRRLYLLSILMGAPNILILDEPTNDLDIGVLAILEDYIDSFAGAVIAVSHDRYFLDRTANFIFEVKKTGEITRYTGNYTDFEQNRVIELEHEQKKESIKKEQPRKEKKTKLTYKEEKEYQSIEEDIAVIEEKIENCDKDMVKFSTDHTKLGDILKDKESLEKLLEEKMDRWAYLEELVEKIKSE